MLKPPASSIPSMDVALLIEGSLKSLYQSGRSTSGRSRVEQKCSRSSGTLRFAVRPWCVTDRQNGNFQRYTIDLARSVSRRGLSSLLRCRVMLDKSWKILILEPLKDNWFLLLALYRISSFNGKSVRQHIASLGGSVSFPLGRSALCIRSKAIGVSGGLSRRSLKILVTACERWLGSMDSGIPLTLRLRRLPLLSRSSMCRLISLRCMACDSVSCCTWQRDASWRACVVSTSSTLRAIAWMSALKSEIAAERVFFMSNATLRRSSRLSAGDVRFSELSLPRRGLLLCERDSRGKASCDGCVPPLGLVRNISGIWRLSCVSGSGAGLGLVAGTLLDVLSIL